MIDAIEPKRGERRRGGRWTSTLILAATISGVMLVFAGCDTTVDAITDTERPTNVSASDGEYTNEIRVTWTAPQPAEDGTGDEAPDLIGYDVIRSDTAGGSVSLSGSLLDTAATSYVDSRTSLLQGVPYEYEIQAVYSDGTRPKSDPDTGYAITASEISAGSTLSRYARTYDTTQAHASANGNVWFRLLVQQGWEYEVRADSSTPTVRFLHENQLEPASGTYDSETGSYTFAADRSGFYFIELEGGSGSVSVRYLGAN